MLTPKRPLSLGEFTVLVAMMVSIVALSTDIMLPALDLIGEELNVVHRNDVQMVVSALFLGFAVGQVAVGPLADSFGRKPVIYAGYGVFILGCMLSIFAQAFEWMLVGRVLQGLGAAAPRVVTTALVRDGYEGRAMARIMSLIMAVFIIVPAIAPAIGQFIIAFAGWRATFVALLVMASTAAVWFALRQPETLAVEARRPFSLGNIMRGIGEILRMRAVVGYTLCAGCVFGAFLGYLSSAQQIFVDTYGAGERFALYFGIASLAIGAASLLNARLVMRLGMRYLVWRALVVLALLSGALALALGFTDLALSLWAFMAWQMPAFFCVGLLFGNLNALAMNPVGHMAGLGAAFLGSMSTLISLPFGWSIGAAYDGTPLPLIAGFGVLGVCALAVMAWTDRGESE